MDVLRLSWHFHPYLRRRLLRLRTSLVQCYLFDRRKPENEPTGNFLAEQLQVEFDQRRPLPFQPFPQSILLFLAVNTRLHLAQVGQQTQPDPAFQRIAPFHLAE